MNYGYIELEEEIIDKVKKMGGDILVLGYIYVKKLYMDDNLIVINLGSIFILKDGSYFVVIIDIIKIDDEDEFEFDINLIDINIGNIININD